MTWLLPSALVIAGAAALAMVLVHFIARSRPMAEPLPTARFVPPRPIHARARAIALTDVLLLLVRVAALLAIGLAIAGPIVSAHGRIARVVVADRSRDVGDLTEVRDSARAYLRSGDQLVMFDTIAPQAGVSVFDSLPRSNASGSLSAALAAAIRSAVPLASRADSVELVLVSPMSAEELDDATARIRATWPGRIRLVSTRLAEVKLDSAHVEARGDANDAVVAGLSLMGVLQTPASVRVVRGEATAADSAWARVGGHVLVHWPDDADSAQWPRRTVIDAIGGVASSSGTIISRFPRAWTLDGPGTVIARWADGEAAAVERAEGDGCIRDVAVLLDQASDITLRGSFRRFAADLVAPCGGRRHPGRIAATTLASLSGAGPLASAGALRDRMSDSSRWTPWLLVLGAALLIVELAMRRSEARPA